VGEKIGVLSVLLGKSEENRHVGRSRVRWDDDNENNL
jgi:hypothetical protein